MSNETTTSDIWSIIRSKSEISTPASWHTPDIWLFVVPRVETGIRHHWVVLEWKISHCFKRVRLIWTRCLEIIFVSPVQQLLNIQSYSVLPVFGACWQRTRPGAGNRMFNGNQKAKAREDEKPNRTNESEIRGLHYSRICIKCALAWVLKTTPAAIPDQGWSAGPRLFQYCIYIVLFPLSSNYRKQINQGTTQVDLFTLAPL